MTTSNDIRQAFLDYFARQGHKVVPSSPLVPRNDPTLLFTNAGMVQFKNVFTGVEKRDYARAASAQKCVRAGGKHNDLERVGYTARHHTFFEMLGNFSFGDYFKDRAIELAWNLIAREYAVSADRLIVTVYAEDDEAFGLWRKIAGLDERRIVRIATSDNFWSMGDTGPCGPCSEIFYDHGSHIAGGPPGRPDQDGDRFVEIWNLVFMQYDQQAPGRRIDLPHPSIDTGMGLERIAAVLQGVHDNYDTDALRTLIRASAECSGVSATGERAVSHRVIADHVRAAGFLIADGVLPSNEGRGYVLRRIMRRAMRHVHLLGTKDPLLHRLVPALRGLMGQAYPELARAEALIVDTLRLEETRFRDTLERGLKLLGEEIERLPASGALPGDIAFRLYDTFGFPLDLTEDILRGHGRGVDIDGFNAAMERQRANARAAWSGSGEEAEGAQWFALRERLGATEFVGYDSDMAAGSVLALLKDGGAVERAAAGETVAVILNQTPFYAESGGQMGDRGVLFSAAGAEIAVRDTQKKAGDLHVHLGQVSSGHLAVDDIVEARVDGERRARLRAHHSATHLLHEALRRTLGPHVTQKGSLVAPDRLRFDISHPKAMTPGEIREVEASVNAAIRGNGDVATRLMSTEAAVEEGAAALFGEKYGDEVRVVSMGGADEKRFSLELCGGTHVRRTGDIGFFKIVSESALASGVRRIEAVAAKAAEDHVAAEQERLRAAAHALKATPAELPDRIAALVEERKRLERELIEARKALATGGGAEPDAKIVKGIKVSARNVEGAAPKDLKSMADALKKKIGSGIVALSTVNDGTVSVVVSVTDDVKDRVNAVDVVRAAAAAVGGKGGGGRPDMAQAGGPDASNVDKIPAAIYAWVDANVT